MHLGLTLLLVLLYAVYGELSKYLAHIGWDIAENVNNKAVEPFGMTETSCVCLFLLVCNANVMASTYSHSR